MASLTVKYIESLERRVRAGEKVKEWHPDGDGLYLRVLPSGRMSFELRRRPFKPFPIGPAAMGLPHARTEARKALVQQAQGVDPAAERAVAKAAKAAERAKADETFGFIVERFIERYARPELRTWKNIERGLGKDAVPVWGKLPITDISRKMVGELVDGIVDRGAPRQAALVYAYLHKFFKWAVGRGYIDTNPAENLPKPKQAPSRERVLSDHELRLIWQVSAGLGWPFEPILKLLALTGQRKSEIAAGVWSEIDFKGKVWNLPASRTKNKKAHAFPLSEPVIGILETLPRIEDGSRKSQGLADLIFTTTGSTAVSGFGRAKANLDASIAALNSGEPIPDWTWHDFRRTAATGMARLNIAPHTIEAVLNHKSGVVSGVAAVYNRHNYEEEMRTALDAWAHKLHEIVTEKQERFSAAFLEKRGGQ